MVATLLSLKLHLTVADLKRSTTRLVLWIIMAASILILLFFALIGLALSSLAVAGHEANAGSITIFVGSVLVFGWALIPLVFFGFDQTLDPARFAQFSLTGRQLAPGLVLAGVLGLPGLLTAVLCLGSSLCWLMTPLVALVGLVGGALGFLMTQVCCRVTTTALSGTLSTRKARDMTGLIGLVLILVLSMSGYAISMAVNLFMAAPANLADAWSVVEKISAVLSFTPLGAPWAMVSDAGQGQWLMLLAHLVLTCAYLGLGLWLYSAILNKALVAPAQLRSTGSTGALTKNLVARLTNIRWVKGALVPVAAIVARCLRYWRRDPRYLGQIVSILMLPIIFTVIGLGLQLISPDDATDQIMQYMTQAMIAFGLGFMALMAGYAISADVAYDSTAWWIHLATGVKGWQDRLGRLIAQATVSTPLVLIAAFAVPLIIQDPGVIAKALASMAALFLVSLGVSSVFSALIIYPTALPGESPLKMRSGMMGSQMLSQFGCMGITVVLALPICIWAFFATGWLSWLALVVAIIWGGALAVAGVVLGGRIMDARGPAILATLMKNDSRERA
ncbi:MAG: hypothetical protein FWF30_05070 [Coriobacteriia bacterium]|nr:hypothetical protein [Coriobacteriia bacterium]